MKERCTITIEFDNTADNSGRFREEDVVKEAWPYMLPWFTRRHGVESGKIQLNENVTISWQYTSEDEDSKSYDFPVARKRKLAKT